MQSVMASDPITLLLMHWMAMSVMLSFTSPLVLYSLKRRAPVNLRLNGFCMPPVMK